MNITYSSCNSATLAPPGSRFKFKLLAGHVDRSRTPPGGTDVTVTSGLDSVPPGPGRPRLRRGPGTVVVGGPTKAALVGSGPGRVYGPPAARAAAAAAAPATVTVQTEVRTRAGAVMTRDLSARPRRDSY